MSITHNTSGQSLYHYSKSEVSKNRKSNLLDRDRKLSRREKRKLERKINRSIKKDNSLVK